MPDQKTAVHQPVKCCRILLQIELLSAFELMNLGDIAQSLAVLAALFQFCIIKCPHVPPISFRFLPKYSPCCAIAQPQNQLFSRRALQLSESPAFQLFTPERIQQVFFQQTACNQRELVAVHRPKHSVVQTVETNKEHHSHRRCHARNPENNAQGTRDRQPQALQSQSGTRRQLELPAVQPPWTLTDIHRTGQPLRQSGISLPDCRLADAAGKICPRPWTKREPTGGAPLSTTANPIGGSTPATTSMSPTLPWGRLC